VQLEIVVDSLSRPGRRGVTAAGASTSGGFRMRRLSVSAAVAVLVVLVAAACGPLDAPSGPAPLRYRDPVFSAVTTTSNITYGTAVDQNNQTVTLELDMYRPTGDTLTSRPAIVWVHGGSFYTGDKTSPELVDEATQFALEGYVNVSINYRLSPQSCLGTITAACIIGIVQAMQDAQTAVRFLREQAATYGIDPTRIAIGGSSAGAITALNVGYNSQTPGPGDHQGFSSAVRAAQSLSGAAIPNSSIGAGDAPALLLHGTADPIVPYSLAQTTVSKAQAAGLVAVLVSFTGDGHVPYAKNRTTILEDTRNFFYNEMDLAHAAQ
jgi:acetyl esterase/lipase